MVSAIISWCTMPHADMIRQSQPSRIKNQRKRGITWISNANESRWSHGALILRQQLPGMSLSIIFGKRKWNNMSHNIAASFYPPSTIQEVGYANLYHRLDPTPIANIIVYIYILGLHKPWLSELLCFGSASCKVRIM